MFKLIALAAGALVALAVALFAPIPWIAWMLTVLALTLWFYRVIPDGWLNLWTYVVMFGLSVALGGNVAWLVEFILGWSSTAAFIGPVFGTAFGVTLFVYSVVKHDPIPQQRGSIATPGGYPVPLELRAGGFALPCKVYREPATGEFVEMVREPTEEITIEATAPSGTKVRAKLSLETWVQSVFWYQKAKKHDDILLQAANGMTKTAIEHIDTGHTGAETAQNREDIRKTVQVELQDEGDEIGIGVKLVMREMLPPEEVMTSAQAEEVATNNAKALAVAAEERTKRAAKFASENNMTRVHSLNALRTDEGHATQTIFTFEGVHEALATLQSFIGRLGGIPKS